MLCSMSKKGKFVRLGVGAAIIFAGIHFQSWWGALGAVVIAAAFFGLCPTEFFCGGHKKKK